MPANEVARVLSHGQPYLAQEGENQA
jgi:hypothetical protein